MRLEYDKDDHIKSKTEYNVYHRGILVCYISYYGVLYTGFTWKLTFMHRDGLLYFAGSIGILKVFTGGLLS